ncbi:hypothetical protein GA0115240_127713 [Streptomyces sp. DvalAA-14]|uniref:hypothetical protein n=1 Tax=unclassified Streptomyces TaxID=2593676 RepID=UPI00081B80C4|nr:MULTISPECIES: hypothetical protein [unclassified Streptomyces]MYS21216.1 hypothetical protein [Streptomyces sp. SID4948]SCD87088.1 hypothetical protein GA0115240_127713 [Streptomyces sp. DvalAA-14]
MTSPTNPNSNIDAITAVYSSTRADNSSIMNIGLALVGVGATYAVGTLAFADKFGSVIPWNLVPALPLLMWMIAAFHSQLTICAMLNAVTIQRLEKELLLRTGLAQSIRDVIGYTPTEKIMNIMISRWPHKITTAITYVGVFVVVGGYTAYVLVKASAHIGGMIYVYGAIYAGAAVAVLWAWQDGLQQSEDNKREAGL